MPDDNKKPFLASFFSVEINGLNVGKFMSCDGLEAEAYIYEVEEGGDNSHTHKFLGRTRFPNMVLENGVTANNDLYKWFKDSCRTDNKVERKDGSVVLYQYGDKNELKEIKRWNFYKALPCRWVGPKLSSSNNNIAVERVEIAYEYVEVDDKK